MQSKVFKLTIAGGRDFKNYTLLCRLADLAVKRLVAEGVFIIVNCGLATGADTLGKEWALSHGYQVDDYPADWDDVTAPGAVVRKREDGKLYNAAAGSWRNQKMGENSDAALIFWDGQSRGTKDMIAIIKRLGLRLRVFSYVGILIEQN